MSKVDCKQSINGILLVNKPQGLSSNAVLQRVKRLYKAKKAGHTGSLDPLATGMLPICFGEATKFCQYLLDSDKCYESTGLLGVKTDTADAMGEVISQSIPFNISQEELLETLEQFKGIIKQIPSMYSALKHKGTPLYKFAREGINIEREAREICIHQLDLMDFDGKYFNISVTCSKGTYIRNLVEDIGDALSVGAHVTRLHRPHTAGFSKERMYDLTELENKSSDDLLECLLPMERAVNYLPRLRLTDEEVFILRQGKTLDKVVLDDVETCVRLHNERAQFIGLGEFIDHQVLAVKRLLTEQSVETSIF